MGAFGHLEWTYDGAFEQPFGLGRGEFEQKFSKNSTAWGVLPGGGMLKLRFDWYINSHTLKNTSFMPKRTRDVLAATLCKTKVHLPRIA